MEISVLNGKSIDKKCVLFLLLMGILIVPFLKGFITDINGDQGLVFIGRATNYMADYYNVAEYAADRNPYGYGREEEIVDAAERAYPPLAYLIAYYQSKAADYLNLSGLQAGRTDLGVATSALFMFFAAGWYILLLYDSIKKPPLYKVLILLCLMLSGIFIFSYERGNNIFLTALCSSFFVLHYNSRNKVTAECACIALAFAAGLKVYPALLGILLLFDKNYKAALRLIIYGIAFGFLPFLFFKGGFSNIPLLLSNLQVSSDTYAMLVFPRFNFRYWASQIADSGTKMAVYRIMSGINMVFCCGAVAASYFQKEHWKRIVLLLLVLMIFPVNSAQYAGLYLFVGIVLFLNEEKWSLPDVVYLLLTVLILNPFQVVFHGYNCTTWAMNFAASAMLILLLAETLHERISFLIRTKYRR